MFRDEMNTMTPDNQNSLENEAVHSTEVHESVKETTAEINTHATQQTAAETESKPEEAMENRYEDSGIDEEILRAVKEMGFEQMTPIQAQAIPVFLEGKDIIGQAQTGTGKTAAFGIPALMSVDAANMSTQVLVLCPTRELAIQASEEMRKFAKFKHGIKVLPIYGGQDISKQIRNLKSGVQIVVGTPGRVMDHMRRHTLKLQDLKVIILDEADEMLNMGFREDIETILKETPSERQTALFSATMPKEILRITSTYQKPDAELIKVAQKELTIPLVKQYYYEVPRQSKEEVICRLLDYYNPKRSLIFCNTKRMVDELADHLKGRGYFAEGLHGDLSQNQRDTVMNLFRSGRADILIATDVAARGIDVDDVEAVFNYDIPQDIEYYVHRIGRTGRAGKKGRSFTLVAGREVYKIRDIERSCKTKVKVRSIPSVSDVTALKVEKVLNEAIGLIESENLSNMIKAVEEKLNDSDITALELAAAFLKQGMGEEPKEIELFQKSYRGGDRKGKGRDGRGRDRDGFGKGRGDRGGYGKGRGERDDYKKRDRDGFKKDKGGRKDDKFKDAFKSAAKSKDKPKKSKSFGKDTGEVYFAKSLLKGSKDKKDDKKDDKKKFYGESNRDRREKRKKKETDSFM